MLPHILECVALISLSVAAPRPHAYVALALSVLALLAVVTGWHP